MKAVVLFFVFCALVEINQARFVTVYGEIDNHEYIGEKKAFVAADPGTATVGMTFKFPPVP